jgi:hypothetical protein
MCVLANAMPGLLRMGRDVTTLLGLDPAEPSPAWWCLLGAGHGLKIGIELFDVN